ncbi:MAG: NrsF family protein [Alphaproteobacteria bacterium]|nr:NrsF family protein [Alphaproteobacteria bacterium]
MTKDKNKPDVNDLIDNLCGELTPVCKKSPYRSIFIWVLLSALYISGVILYYGPKIDLINSLSEASFIFEIIIAGSIFIFGAIASSFLSFPDEVQKTWPKIVTLVLFCVFITWIFANIIEEGISDRIFTLGSCYKGIFVEAIPFVALIFITMRGHSTKPYWLMAMNVMSVSALGWIGLRITCSMYDSMLYSFTHYLLPFAVLSVAIGLFARKIFKW